MLIDLLLILLLLGCIGGGGYYRGWYGPRAYEPRFAGNLIFIVLFVLLLLFLLSPWPFPHVWYRY